MEQTIVSNILGKIILFEPLAMGFALQCWTHLAQRRESVRRYLRYLDRVLTCNRAEILCEKDIVAPRILIYHRF